MRWILCSERLPSSKMVDTYFVKQRIKDSNEDWFPGAITYSGEWEISEDYEVIEWLDESESSSPLPIKDEINKLRCKLGVGEYHEDKDAIQFSIWAAKNNWQYDVELDNWWNIKNKLYKMQLTSSEIYEKYKTENNIP